MCRGQTMHWRSCGSWRLMCAPLRVVSSSGGSLEGTALPARVGARQIQPSLCLAGIVPLSLPPHGTSLQVHHCNALPRRPHRRRLPALSPPAGREVQHPGTYLGVAERAAHIRAVGANAVVVTPCYATAKGESGCPCPPGPVQLIVFLLVVVFCPGGASRCCSQALLPLLSQTLAGWQPAWFSAHTCSPSPCSHPRPGPCLLPRQASACCRARRCT